MSSGAGTGNLLLLLLPLLLLGFLMWTQRKRSRDMQAVNASLTVGDEVMTSSGLYGRIVALDDSIATLEVAPGVIITSSITNAAIEELGLAEGKKAVAVVKASSVMVGLQD